MPEELTAVGGEKPMEGVVMEGGAGRKSETAPEGVVEQVPERAPETTKEKFSEILSKAPQTGGSDAVSDEGTVEVDAKSVYDETDAEARVTKLLSLAEAKGVAHAVRVAEKINDFYVLDRMHDELSEKFYDALVAKGLIEG